MFETIANCPDNVGTGNYYEQRRLFKTNYSK